jgi:hypothetical protein
VGLLTRNGVVLYKHYFMRTILFCAVKPLASILYR